MAFVRGFRTCFAVARHNIMTENIQSSILKRFCSISQTSKQEPVTEKQTIQVTFVKGDGERLKASGKVGDTLLDIVVNNDLDLDGYGACEGTLTCSTCHLIFSKEVYDSLPEQPTDEELDMLDLAFELTDTSRLGCQIVMTKELDGLEVRVPKTINDVRS